MNQKSNSANGSFFTGRKASESRRRAKLQASLRLEQLEARMLLDGMSLLGGAMVQDVETPAVVVVAGESQPMAASGFEGYNVDDIAALQTFLTANDNANGKAVNPNFDALNAATWNVTWTQSSGENRLTAINWMDKGVSGSLDLSGCETLQSLNLSGNDLTSLDVSGCDMLKQLACVNNKLATLVVNEKIEVLLCDNNNIETLDLNGRDSLEYFTCSNNDLTSLDLSDCSMLAELDCSGNDLGSLNVSNNLKLETLLCGDCGLNMLNVTNNVKLTALDCEENSIQELDLTKNAELESLWCALNDIENLDISQNLKLNELNCWNENLESICVYHVQPSAMRFSLDDAGMDVKWTRDGELVARDLVVDLTRAIGSTAELEGGQQIFVQNIASSLEVSVDGMRMDLYWMSLPDTNRYQVEYRVGTGRWTTKAVTGTQYTLSGSVGKTYEFRVRALDVEDSRYTETVTVAFPAQPSLSVPKNSVQDETFQVQISNWAALKDAEVTDYQIYIDKIGGVSVAYESDPLSCDETNDNEEYLLTNGVSVALNRETGILTFSGTVKLTSYNFKVNFGNDVSTSPYSKNISVTTSKTTYKPVSNVVSEGYSATQLTVQWDAPINVQPDTVYTVQYSKDGNRWSTATNAAQKTDDGYIINKLSANTTYYVQVFASANKTMNAGTPVEAAETTKTWAKLATPSIKATTVSDDNAKVTVSNYVSSDLKDADSARITIGEASEAFTIDSLESGTSWGDYTLHFDTTTGVLSISGLHSVTKYAFGISFFTANESASDTKSISFTTTKSAFDNVTVLTVETRSATEIFVDWEGVTAKDDSTKSAEAYTIKYAVAGSNKWKGFTVKGGATEATLTKLSPDTDYEIQVFANATRNNTASVESHLETTKTWAKLATPSIKATTVSDDNAKVTVSNYASSDLKDADSARITIGEASEAFAITDLESGTSWEGYTLDFDTTTGILSISGLSSTTKYAFEISFFTENVSASDTKSISFTTTKSAFNDVTELTVETQSATEIFVDWNEVAAKDDSTKSAEAYTIKYAVAGSNKWKGFTVKGGATEATLTKLSPNTNYEIQVFANASRNNTASVESHLETTKTWVKLATPSIKATTVSDDNAKVTVSNYVSSDLKDADSARITIGEASEAFTITDLESGTSWESYTLHFDTTTGVLSISGLSSTTKYAFGISFFTANESASDTKSISFTTTKSAFDDVTVLTVETRSATEIFVDWEGVTAKDDSSKSAEAYTIKYAVAGSNKWKGFTVKGGATEATLTKLSPNTNYEIQVFANATRNNTASVESPLETTKTWAKLATPSIKATTVSDDNAKVTVSNYASSDLKDADSARITIGEASEAFTIDSLESGTSWGDYTLHFDTTTGVLSISGLHSVTKYAFGISFFTANESASDTKSISFTTTKSPFDDVEILSATQVSDTNAITVNWNPSCAKGTTTDADAYSVKYRIVGTSRWSSVTAKNTTSATISRLKLGNKYEIQVFANSTRTYLASVSSETVEVQL